MFSLFFWAIAAFLTGNAGAEGTKDHVFRFEKPEAQSVALSGGFNRWHGQPMTKQSDGSWSLTVPLNPGTHGYKFLVNGSEWVFDPANANRKTVDGIENSAVEIGGPNELVNDKPNDAPATAPPAASPPESPLGVSSLSPFAPAPASRRSQAKSYSRRPNSPRPTAHSRRRGERETHDRAGRTRGAPGIQSEEIVADSDHQQHGELFEHRRDERVQGRGRRGRLGYPGGGPDRRGEGCAGRLARTLCGGGAR